MSKKFKGKLCAYCAADVATTEDHVFAREFFLLENRSHLPKVPACYSCNNSKSKLEHYLVSVLPLGGKHPQAADTLLRGARRFHKNRRLQNHLTESMNPLWLKEGDGIFRQTRMYSFDGAKLREWLEFVGRGLMHHHWSVYPRKGDTVGVSFRTDFGEILFQRLIGELRPHSRVARSLGNGTVEYVGLQATDRPELTLWSVRMYGGLTVADDAVGFDGLLPTSSVWSLVTGPPSLTEDW